MSIRAVHAVGVPNPPTLLTWNRSA